MRAEIITIGDEILIGQIVDTNSAWIAEQLTDIGVRIDQITSIPDNPEEIKSALDTAMKRSEIVITTGGLGPTKDDITKQTIADYFGVSLILNKAVFEHNRKRMENRGVDFNHSNQQQAYLPEGCMVLHNNYGTAPGMLMRKNESILISLPGVPFEMKELITRQLIPLLKKELTLQTIIHRTVFAFGIAESVLSETVAEWEDNLPKQLHLAYLPNPRGIRLRLSAYGINGTEAVDVEKEITKQLEKLQTIIPQYYLGYQPNGVEGALAEILQNRQQTLAVAESCTGGTISSRITAIPGASKHFIGGITAYSNKLKIKLLGVLPKDIQNHGAVSQSVVEQMAMGVRELMQADYSIATTGIAGPIGGDESSEERIEKSVGKVWIAIAWDGGVESHKFQFGELRDVNIERASSQALNMLRKHLIKQ